MSEPAYRPLDVVAAMAALGLSGDLRDAFFEATEDYALLSIKQMNEGMRVAGLSVGDRMAVQTQLGAAPTAPLSPDKGHPFAFGATPAAHQEVRVCVRARTVVCDRVIW